MRTFDPRKVFYQRALMEYEISVAQKSGIKIFSHVLCTDVFILCHVNIKKKNQCSFNMENE